MPPTCTAHRPYLAAIADGELSLVPDATRGHVAECATCSADVATLALVGEQLRVAIASSRPTMFASNDPNAIAGWCSRAWHSRPPAVWIPTP
jgi:hypothetical protein